MTNRHKHYQVSYLPWIRLGPMKIGAVEFLPFYHADTKKKIKDKKIYRFLENYFQSYVHNDLKPVDTITLVFHKDIDFAVSDFNRNEARKAVDAIIFSTITKSSVIGISSSNRSMGPPSSETYQLLHKNFHPDDTHLAVRAGSSLHGGYKIGEVKFTKPWTIGGFGAPGQAWLI